MKKTVFLLLFSSILFFNLSHAQRNMFVWKHSIAPYSSFAFGYANVNFDTRPSTFGLEYEIQKKDDAFGIGLQFSFRRSAGIKTDDTTFFYQKFCDPNSNMTALLFGTTDPFLNCFYSIDTRFIDLHVPIFYNRYFDLTSKLSLFVRGSVIFRFDGLHTKGNVVRPIFDANRNFVSNTPQYFSSDDLILGTPRVNLGLGGGVNYSMTNWLSVWSRLHYQIGKNNGYFDETIPIFDRLFLMAGLKFQLKNKR